MYYEINISKNGAHYFATAERSIRTNIKARTVYYELLKRFPATEGYEISVIKWRSSGVPVDMEGEV